MNNSQNNFMIPMSIIVVGVMISAALFFGLQKTNNVLGTNSNTNTPAVTVAPDATPTPMIVQVSTGNAPMLGDKNAPITIIEFSDYECPYCKQSFTTMIPDLTKEMIDTGKVKFYFRNYPLYFHDPAATKDAMVALCAKDQGNDDTYYKMHDLLFTNSGGNGTGITEDKLKEMVTSLKLDYTKLSKCVEDKKFSDVIANDMADAEAIGINGTPSYVIGKSSSNGTITGEVLIGAYPYTAVKALIDQYSN